jgi:hypothetical protein
MSNPKLLKPILLKTKIIELRNNRFLHARVWKLADIPALKELEIALHCSCVLADLDNPHE